MHNFHEEQCITVSLDKRLVDQIVDFKGYNRQTYLDFSKESDLKFGVEEKLYTILRYASDFIETAKREVEGFFTVDEALLIFVCLADEDIRLDFGEPGRELMLLIYHKREILKEFYNSTLPMDIIGKISKKSKFLTSSQFCLWQTKNVTFGN